MSTQPLITDQMRRLLQAQAAVPAPAPVPVAMPQQMQPLAVPTMPQVANVPNAPDLTSRRLLTDQNELRRLQTSGSGIDQITKPVDASGNPTGAPVSGLRKFGGVLARIGDAAATLALGRGAAVIPGTTMRHYADMDRQAGMVNNDLGNQQEQAQTKLLDAQPQLKQMAAENAMLKTQGLLGHYEDQANHWNDQTDAALGEHGYRRDATGALVPMKYEELSAPLQAVEDLKHAQQEQAEATAAMNKAKNDPTSPAFLLAKRRADNATTMTQVALGRLANQGRSLDMRAETLAATNYGTDTHGTPLAGSMIADDGRSVGSKFQGNVRPTGLERSKADMAASASQQIETMKQIVLKHPGMFGPGYGQATNFKQWVGSQDPDAQRFIAARTIAGDHLAGTFGGRSEAALHALDTALGQFKDNPRAALAGLDQLAGANAAFEKAGTVKTAGSHAGAASSGPKAGDVVDGYRFKGGNPADQKNWEKQ